MVTNTQKLSFIVKNLINNISTSFNKLSNDFRGRPCDRFKWILSY